jgi:hypothetical protein
VAASVTLTIWRCVCGTLNDMPLPDERRFCQGCRYEDPIIDTTYTAVVAGEGMMNAMATYTGPAALILPDNTEVDVRAVLTSYTNNHLQGWRGTLTAIGADSMWDGVRETCQIRTADGRLGDVIITRFNPGPSGEVAEVTGSGPAPF